MCRTRQHMHKGCRMHETTMKSHVVVRLQVRGKTGNRVALVRNTATICAHENPSLAVAWGAFESNLDPTTCSMRDQGGGGWISVVSFGGHVQFSTFRESDNASVWGGGCISVHHSVDRGQAGQKAVSSTGHMKAFDTINGIQTVE